MKRTRTIGLWLVLGGLTACSGGGYPAYSYTGGQPGGYDDDGGETEGEGSEGGIDLDGGAPKPPPGGDGPAPPPTNHGDCCAGNGTPGCDNKPVELCVCESDQWCCESEWDDACAALIEQLGCGHCVEGEGDPPPPPPVEGDCCSEHGTPGCNDAAVEACVCDVEPFCCDNQWSAACTAVLEVHGCGECGGDPPPPGGDTGGDTGGDPPPGGDTGGDPPPGGGGDCCASNGSPGCDDGAIESCVCMQDAYCCDTDWDGLCASQVESFGCGSCGGGDGGGGGDSGGAETGGGGGISACCEQQAGAGCPDTDVEACVCAQDDYCCSVFWDLTCAGEVELLGCGSCS